MRPGHLEQFGIRQAIWVKVVLNGDGWPEHNLIACASQLQGEEGLLPKAKGARPQLGIKGRHLFQHAPREGHVGADKGSWRSSFSDGAGANEDLQEAD
jgi:hypothetical protein